jgi:hypothetical protein
MNSIRTFGKLCSGAKTLGWERSNGTSKDDFKNLGVVLCSTDGFQKCVLKIRWGDVYPGVGDRSFSKMTLVITRVYPGTINPCNHNYPGMGRGVAE